MPSSKQQPVFLATVNYACDVHQVPTFIQHRQLLNQTAKDWYWAFKITEIEHSSTQNLCKKILPLFSVFLVSSQLPLVNNVQNKKKRKKNLIIYQLNSRTSPITKLDTDKTWFILTSTDSAKGIQVKQNDKAEAKSENLFIIFFLFCDSAMLLHQLHKSCKPSSN